MAHIPDPAESTSNMEESRTIGINDYTDEEVSETKLLEDFGATFRRIDHAGGVVTLP